MIFNIGDIMHASNIGDIMHARLWSQLITFTLVLGLFSGCNDDPHIAEQVIVPSTYAFESRFSEDSSVAYRGQIFRHVLIQSLELYLDNLTARIDGNPALNPATGEIVAELNALYDFKAAVTNSQPLPFTTEPATLQKTLGDFQSAATLKEKIAGNDAIGQHKNWSNAFVGWSSTPIAPDALVQQWFAAIETLAVARGQGTTATTPAGQPIDHVYVSAAGIDYKELLQKFMLGAIAFSQATDDYLDSDLPDKGLNSDNSQPDGMNAYTALEHAWDEAVGYFGAARDFKAYSLEEVRGISGRPDYISGYHDTNSDGQIDVETEYNFTFPRYAAARDLAAPVKTDFSVTLFDAMLHGRLLIAQSDNSIDDDTRHELLAHRDVVRLTWEKIIAASVVRYINSVLRHMSSFGSSDYDFYSHAAHWSEAKGLALGLQFNPASPLSDQDFAVLQRKLGDGPVLPEHPELVPAFRQNLIDARGLIGTAYGFAAGNLDEHMGW